MNDREALKVPIRPCPGPRPSCDQHAIEQRSGRPDTQGRRCARSRRQGVVSCGDVVGAGPVSGTRGC